MSSERALSTALWDWIEAEGLQGEEAEELHIDLMDRVLSVTAQATREIDSV